MDNEAEHPDDPDDGWDSRHRDERSASAAASGVFDEDEAALREAESGAAGQEEDNDVMELIATQSQPVRPPPTPAQQSEPLREMQDDADDELREIGDDEEAEASNAPRTLPPPVFRPVHFDLAEDIEKSVSRRLRKNHEAVLEELPKWGLLAKVLKEIEDTTARIQTSHAGRSRDSSEQCR